MQGGKKGEFGQSFGEVGLWDVGSTKLKWDAGLFFEMRDTWACLNANGRREKKWQGGKGWGQPLLWPAMIPTSGIRTLV